MITTENLVQVLIIISIVYILLGIKLPTNRLLIVAFIWSILYFYTRNYEKETFVSPEDMDMDEGELYRKETFKLKKIKIKKPSVKKLIKKSKSSIKKFTLKQYDNIHDILGECETRNELIAKTAIVSATVALTGGASLAVKDVSKMLVDELIGEVVKGDVDATIDKGVKKLNDLMILILDQIHDKINKLKIGPEIIKTTIQKLISIIEDEGKEYFLCILTKIIKTLVYKKTGVEAGSPILKSIANGDIEGALSALFAMIICFIKGEEKYIFIDTVASIKNNKIIMEGSIIESVFKKPVVKVKASGFNIAWTIILILYYQLNIGECDNIRATMGIGIAKKVLKKLKGVLND